MQTLLVETEINYSGKELKPHWIYHNFGILGDAVAAFIGPCRVEADDLVDQVDKKARDIIYSERMLHFLIEQFGVALKEAVLHQRLLVCLIQEELNKEKIYVQRSGDDLFFQGRKLSVSIATVSLVSALIHFGINISSKNTPLPTANLSELNIEPRAFAATIMEKYQKELASMAAAVCKVRGV